MIHFSSATIKLSGVLLLGLASAPTSLRAEPPPEPSASEDIAEHRQQAAEHQRLAREHASEAMKLHREEVRAKVKDLRDSARERGAVVREELKQVGALARERLKEAGQQLKAAGQAAGEQLKEARDDLHEGLAAGKAELELAGEKLNQEFAELRVRAQEARVRAWSQWKAKLRSPEAIDARMQRELDKHARREAKLQRIESLARDAGDADALERAARLRAVEAERHAARMKKLTEHKAAADQRSASPEQQL